MEFPEIGGWRQVEPPVALERFDAQWFLNAAEGLYGVAAVSRERFTGPGRDHPERIFIRQAFSVELVAARPDMVEVLLRDSALALAQSTTPS